jgi:tRNA U38,U39,U40 pseudouridine synthase TruA
MSLVSTLNSDDIRKITISRGARTDKGVHALCNILALKL